MREGEGEGYALPRARVDLLSLLIVFFFFNILALRSYIKI